VVPPSIPRKASAGLLRNQRPPTFLSNPTLLRRVRNTPYAPAPLLQPFLSNFLYTVRTSASYAPSTACYLFDEPTFRYPVPELNSPLEFSSCNFCVVGTPPVGTCRIFPPFFSLLLGRHSAPFNFLSLGPFFSPEPISSPLPPGPAWISLQSLPTPIGTIEEEPFCLATPTPTPFELPSIFLSQTHF